MVHQDLGRIYYKLLLMRKSKQLIRKYNKTKLDMVKTDEQPKLQFYYVLSSGNEFDKVFNIFEEIDNKHYNRNEYKPRLAYKK